MKELVFICGKCGHSVFVDEKKGWVKKFLSDCPNCGEEPDTNWLLRGYGNFKREYPHLQGEKST